MPQENQINPTPILKILNLISLGNGFLITSFLMLLLRLKTSVVILLKATKGKSQNRISLKQQRFLKNDKSESFRFLSS